MESLKKFINSQILIDELDLNVILNNFEELKILKENIVFKKNQIVSNYYYVKSGGLRIYFDQNEREITSWIALENEFFTDLKSLKKQIPTRFNVQALENSVIFTIKSDIMEQLYNQYPAWQQFGRQIWETNFLNLIEGVTSFQTMTAEERYLKMMQESELLQRVPLKHLASFLGVTPSSLSRLRKTIK
jgi:CRP-like cAMP-binding protein